MPTRDEQGRGRAPAQLPLPRALAGSSSGLVWVWGGHGSGKSHLLQAACRAADAAGKRAMYLPLARADIVPEALAGLDALDFLAVDDIGDRAGRPEWERALFD